MSTPNGPGPGMAGLKSYEDELMKFWQPNMETARWIPTHICIVCCDTGFTDFNGVSTACTECLFGMRGTVLGDQAILSGVNVHYTKTKENKMADFICKACQDRGCELCTKKSKPEDPWKHRSEGMTCKTCMWNITKKVAQPASQSNPTAEPQPGNIGRCRRHAPTMNGYPVVFTNDWCGDHKVDETKI